MEYFQNKIYQQDLDIALKNIKDLTKLKKQTILITGASGLIGSFIVDVLYTANHNMQLDIQIYAMGRNIKRLFARFPYARNDSNMHFIEHDVIQPFQSVDIHFDYIIHAAGNAYPQAIYSDPVGTIQSSIIGTFNLLELLRKKQGKRLLFVSSGEIYGQALPDTDAFDENYQGYVAPLSVRSCYPLSKRTAENLCISYAKQYGIETVIVRPCHTYGPTMVPSDNRAHAQFLRNGVYHQPIVLQSKGEQVRSYLYVADAASGILTVLLTGENSEAYNLANPHVRISIAELANAIADVAKVDIHHEYHNDQPSPFNRAVLDSDKIEKIGWNAVIDLPTGINHVLEILRT